LKGSSAPVRRVRRKPALALGSLAARRPSTAAGLPKYSAWATCSGHSVTGCAVRYSQQVWVSRPRAARRLVSRARVKPLLSEPSSGSACNCTTVIDGVGAR